MVTISEAEMLILVEFQNCIDNIAAILELEGVEPQDFEDITLGPGPEEGINYIYVGDIGNNQWINGRVEHNRTEFYIYRFPEPDLSKAE